MKQNKVWVYDFETLSNCFIAVYINRDTLEQKTFVIGGNKKWFQNDLVSLIEFLNKDVTHQIGYNNLKFDAQIQQFIINTSSKWLNFTGGEIANIIYNYTQTIIQKQDEKKYLDYPEWKLSFPQCDVFLINHWDNEAKRTSLKWLQFMMDWSDIREMNIDHKIGIQSVQELIDCISYCKNDILSTLEVYKITKGETDINFYKGKDKIALRYNIENEFGIKCLNYNDVKIGEQLIQKGYIKSTGIDKNELYSLKKKEDNNFTFKDCFPDYYSFRTPQFNSFIDSIKDVKITQDKKQEFKLKINNLTLIIAKGGIHSEDSPRLFKSNSDYLLIDADIGSMYPNAIRKRKIYPRHLGEKWLDNYTGIISKRLDAKAKYKETKDKKYKAFDEAFKLALNGGSFGKMGEGRSWQYDLLAMNKVTIGSQIDLLMLIEEFLIANIYIISANTDGVLCYLSREKKGEYDRICKEWEKKVGNDILGQLEFTEYKSFVQTSVNDYLAIKSDGEIKEKGDFVTENELHKNKSARVVPLALRKYFVDKYPIEKFIIEYDNIFDFCCAVRTKSDSSLYTINLNNQEECKQQKTVRYYISNSEICLVKRMNSLNKKVPTNQLDIFGGLDDGTRNIRVNVGYNVSIFNQYEEKEDYNINYGYYINEANKLLKKIVEVKLDKEIDLN